MTMVGNQIVVNMANRDLSGLWEVASSRLSDSPWTRIVTFDDEQYRSTQRMATIDEKVVLLDLDAKSVHVFGID
jgi:hypothetical protein